MTDLTIVTHYGIHRTPDNIVYLHQGGGKASNFIGLAARSPFEVQTQGGRQRACPHMMNPSTPIPDREHWESFMQIFSDQLLQEFLPLPRNIRDPIPFIEDAEDMLLLLLSKLSSPIYPIVSQFDKYPKLRFAEQMALTNVTPVVLTHIRPEHQSELESMCVVARRSPRKLILSGDPRVVLREPMKKITTHLDLFEERKLYSLPMESLGAVSLRRWARGEQINGPWERYEK